ncbi:hypothetical protein [Shewanella sp. NIFS-20-20]|uniref:hypothetical protein n=1 Tax=Shewanella sp. NIFS-20-20 TaxID=2853806 RepID=UPI001C46168D|nr:hypothetical protein [Shewanella sp. NIFS-20-20]MBV7317320.1 hypothetical protein [Shewanella sp. NIFS-20-20]
MLSVTASVFSLQSGVESALQSSKAAQIAQYKVDALQVESTDLQQLQRQQLDANSITAANNTQSLISTRNAELQTLLDDIVAVDDGSQLASVSDYIVLIIASALEVVSVVMTLCLHHLGTHRTRQDGAGHRGTVSVSQPVIAVPGVETRNEPRQFGTISQKAVTLEEVCPELWDEHSNG